MKMKKVKKLEKIRWMVKLYLINLRGKMELEFAKNVKKR